MTVDRWGPRLQLGRRLGLAAAFLASACAPKPAFVPGPQLDFTHDSGSLGEYRFPETMGAGVALFDVDQDGDQDLYAVQGGPLPIGPSGAQAASGARPQAPPNRLFVNQGRARFVDSTSESGAAADRGYGMGVAVADLNGDGWSDLFLTNLGPDRLCLAEPDHAPRFLAGPELAYEPNSTAAAGEWSTAAGCADFDLDGDLDLFVCSYVDWHPEREPGCRSGSLRDYCDVKRYPGLPDHVFANDGRGQFREVSGAWGLPVHAERGLGLALFDADLDGAIDIYVANDTDANRLYLNRLASGRGFDDQSLRSGASASSDGVFEAGMGVAVADLNHDELPDLVVGNFTGEPNSLYLSRGPAVFVESSRRLGIAAPSLHKLTFGIAFEDFDGDGREDLLAVCGHVLRHVDEAATTWGWKQSDQLLLQAVDGRFEEVDAGPFLAEPWSSRGLAVGDLDGDLRPDWVQSTSSGPLRIGLNRMEQQGGGRLCVRLADRRPGAANPSAIGARVSLELSDGRVERRWIRAGGSYLSQDEQSARFAWPKGLLAQAIEVLWPDGERTRHSAPGVSATLCIER